MPCGKDFSLKPRPIESHRANGNEMALALLDSPMTLMALAMNSILLTVAWSGLMLQLKTHYEIQWSPAIPIQSFGLNSWGVCSEAIGTGDRFPLWCKGSSWLRSAFTTGLVSSLLMKLLKVNQKHKHTFWECLLNSFFKIVLGEIMKAPQGETRETYQYNWLKGSEGTEAKEGSEYQENRRQRWK